MRFATFVGACSVVLVLFLSGCKQHDHADHDHTTASGPVSGAAR